MGHSLGLLVKRPIACPCPCFVGVQCHIYICLTVYISALAPMPLHANKERAGALPLQDTTTSKSTTSKSTPKCARQRWSARAHQDATERQSTSRCDREAAEEDAQAEAEGCRDPVLATRDTGS